LRELRSLSPTVQYAGLNFWTICPKVANTLRSTDSAYSFEKEGDLADGWITCCAVERRQELEKWVDLLNEPLSLPLIRVLKNAALVNVDDWLRCRYAESVPGSYRQYLLHADSRERVSAVSSVWGPGQETPIHDDTVWGLFGILRGAEYAQSYSRGRQVPCYSYQEFLR
jgi:hypothetical protein